MEHLTALKDQDRVAMSVGQRDAFVNIYAEQDSVSIQNDLQESIDDIVIKMRLVRLLRSPPPILLGRPWLSLGARKTEREGYQDNVQSARHLV
jgi:pyruvate-formate lyase